MKLTLDSSKLAARLAKAEKELPKKINMALEIVASEGARNIVDRALRGKGYRGNFAPYSPAYAAAKRRGWAASKGRESFSGDPSGKVNLTVSGNMLGNLREDGAKLVRSGLARIAFTRSTENKKAYFNNKKRPFFGFNSKDRKAFIKFFEKQIGI